LALILCYSQIYGQVVPKLTTITTDDGLCFRIVNHVTQDKKGFIWISTEKGLQRYDGYEFVTFYNNKNADVNCPFGKVNRVITEFMDDNTSLVWADEKLYVIDLCDYQVTEFKIEKKYIGVINDIYYSNDKSLFINILQGEKNLLLLYKHNAFKKIAETKTKEFIGNVMIGDAEGNMYRSYADYSVEKYSKNGVLLFQTLVDSSIWFGTKIYYNELIIDPMTDELYLFRASKKEIGRFNQKDKTPQTIVSNTTTSGNGKFDREGNLWFYSDLQIWMYDQNDKKEPIRNYTSSIDNVINFTRIKNTFIDKDNMLWISTNNGIIKLPLNKQLFDKVLYNKNDVWSNEMRDIISTSTGFNIAFCEIGQTGLYKIDKKSRESTLMFPIELTPSLERLKHVAFDKNILWTFGKFLCRIDLETNKIERMPVDIKDFLSPINHSPFAMLNDGKLIFGYHLSDIVIFNPINQKMTKLDIRKTISESILTEFFKEDEEGNIWIGTNYGIFITDKKGKILHEINENTTPRLSNNNCLSILIDHQDRKWIGTFGGGINVLEKSKNGNYTNYVIDKESGLCDDNITAILKDDQHFVWASTYNGISKINADLNNSQNFYVEDGLTNNEFNYSSSMKDEEGKLWFGGLNGITIIDPNKNLEQQNNPPVVLSSFTSYDIRSNEVSREFNDLDNKSRYIISPYTSWFQFNWSLPNYYNSAKNKYFVWLEGLESGYSFHGNNPFIRYNNLPHGEYILHVKATDSKGNPSLGEIAIPIVVKPFFYQTWWFSLLFVLAIGASFYAFYKYNLNKKLAMERMRTQIASDLHDEVGSMLSGLAMQSELLQTEPDSPNFSKFENIANLSRNVVGKMRDLVWSIDSRSDTVRDLIDKMHEKMATLLGPKGINYKLDIKDLPLDKTIPVITRQQLFLIFNEAITNVVRHSNASEVTVSIYHTKTSFEMVIKDNGNTSSQSTVKSTGFGLRNIQMRAAKIKAKIEINKLDGFEVKLTMQKL
jgi:ligand-binding sensor domain-containing protein